MSLPCADTRFSLKLTWTGTFTDFVAYDSETRELDVWKQLSVPQDPVAGIKAGLARFPHPEAIRNARQPSHAASPASRLLPPERSEG